MIDEFDADEVEGSGLNPERCESLFIFLRVLNETYPWLGLIFGGLHTLSEMGSRYRSAFYGSAQHVRVTYMPREDAIRLITQCDNEAFDLEYEPTLVDRLIELTNGQPYLLELLCWHLFERWNARLPSDEATERSLTETDLEDLLNDKTALHSFYEEADYYFAGVWAHIIKEERTLLWAMSRREEPFPMEEADPTAMQLLERHDVIVKSGDGIRFASRLMRDWVSQRSATEG